MDDVKDSLAEILRACWTGNYGVAQQHAKNIGAHIDALTEKADKFMWQVRDTCVRAERAEAECARLQEDAERYRWLRDVPACSLSVARNDGHAPNYMRLSDWVDACPEGYGDTPADELARMKDLNTDWCVQIYPDTPIGFYIFHGATLDAAVDQARAR